MTQDSVNISSEFFLNRLQKILYFVVKRSRLNVYIFRLYAPLIDRRSDFTNNRHTNTGWSACGLNTSKYSQLAVNGHSRKRKAVLTDACFNPRFTVPVKLCIYTFP